MALNPSLTPASCADIVAAVGGVLMRSNRLSQLNRSILSVEKLRKEIQGVIEERVVSNWAGSGADPTKAFTRPMAIPNPN